MNRNEEVRMKKVNKIKAIAAAIALSMVVAIPVVLAQDPPEGQKSERRMGRRGHGKGGAMGGRMFGGGRMFSQLDLTDAQKEQLKQLRQNHRQEVASLRNEIRTKRQEIRQSSQSGAFDEALVAQKLAEIAPLEAKMMAARHRHHQETLSVLTPEQRTKLEQMREQFKNRRTERRSRQEQKTL
jgi:protein CpxP